MCIHAKSPTDFQIAIKVNSERKELEASINEYKKLEERYVKADRQLMKEDLAAQMSQVYQKIKSKQVIIKYGGFNREGASADELGEMGLQLLAIGETEEGLVILLDAALEDHLPSINMLGVIYHKLGNLQESIFWLTRGVQKDNANHPYLPLYYNMAIVSDCISSKSQDAAEKQKYKNLAKKCSGAYRKLVKAFCNMKNDTSVPQYSSLTYIGGDSRGLNEHAKDIMRGKYLP